MALDAQQSGVSSSCRMPPWRTTTHCWVWWQRWHWMRNRVVSDQAAECLHEGPLPTAECGGRDGIGCATEWCLIKLQNASMKDHYPLLSVVAEMALDAQQSGVWSSCRMPPWRTTTHCWVWWQRWHWMRNRVMSDQAAECLHEGPLPTAECGGRDGIGCATEWCLIKRQEPSM